MRKLDLSTIITMCLTLSIFTGCQTRQTLNLVQEKTDYSNPKNWSIKCEKIQHKIDVFFVHPTTYGPPANGKYIADLNDKTLNAKTDADTVNWITAAFSKNCNVFAPRYRQVNIEVMKMPEDQKAKYIPIPFSDVKNALTYYLKNLNKGRPFILASHSQGSDLLQLVLIDNPKLIDHDKLVAAYMPGWTFTNKNIADMELKLSTKADQIGGLIIWNTIGPGGTSPTINKGARCVNPLSWTTDTTNYPASMNQAAKILFADGSQSVIKHFTSAKINDIGALEIPTPKTEILKKLNMSLGQECYHRYDYDFFFYNIIDNVSLRCKTYLDSHQKDSK